MPGMRARAVRRAVERERERQPERERRRRRGSEWCRGENLFGGMYVEWGKE